MKPDRSNRRDFLRAIGIGAMGTLGAAGTGPPYCWAAASGGGPEVARISEHLLVYPGPVNVGILRDGDKALLIDCGDGRVAGALESLGIRSVERVLFTHHHRAAAVYRSDRGGRLIDRSDHQAEADRPQST